MVRALLILPLLAGCDLYFAPSNDAVDGGSLALPDAAIGDCTPPPCQPTSSGGTVCGQIVDLANGRPVTDPAVRFAVRTIGGTPPTVDELHIGACGYYQARGIHVAPNTQIVLEVGDNAVHYDGTAQVLSPPVGDGSLVNGVTLGALRTATDQAWADAVGEPQRWANEGATLFTFRQFGAPLAGVTIDASRFYRFADTDPMLRDDLTVGSLTGADGSLLVPLDAPQYQPSGVVEPQCVWPTAVAGFGLGLLWVVDVDATCQI